MVRLLITFGKLLVSQNMSKTRDEERKRRSSKSNRRSDGLKTRVKNLRMISGGFIIVMLCLFE